MSGRQLSAKAEQTATILDDFLLGRVADPTAAQIADAEFWYQF